MLFGSEIKILGGSAGLIFCTFIIGILRLHWIYLLVCGGAMYALISLKYPQVTVEILRSVEKKHDTSPLERGTERVEWINRMFTRGWFTFRHLIGRQIVAGIKPVIATQKPGFISDITFPVFDLGDSPPYFIFMKGYQDTGSSRALLDVNVIFNNPNARIVTAIHIGPITIPIEIKDLVFEGYARLEMNLQETFPFMNSIGFAFLEKPYFDFGVVPCYTTDILEMPFLHSIMMTIVYGVLETMLIDPYILKINLDELMNAGKSEGIAQAVMVVTLVKGENLPKTDFLGACDAFVKMKVKNQERTSSIVYNSLHPEWNEKFYFLLDDPSSAKLNFTIFDYNTATSDEIISKWVQDLSTFIAINSDPGVPKTNSDVDKKNEVPTDKKAEESESSKMNRFETYHLQEVITVPVVPSGQLTCILDVYKSPSFSSTVLFGDNDEESSVALEAEKLELQSMLNSGDQKIRSGLLRIGIHDISGTSATAKQSWGVTLQTYVKVTVGDEEIYTTKGLDDIEPTWNEICEALILDYRTGSITFNVFTRNQRSAHEVEVGRLSINVKSVVEKGIIKDNQYSLLNNRDIELGISFRFSPMNFGTKSGDKITSAMTRKVAKALGVGLNAHECGVLNVTIDEARNLIAADSNGFSDPYVIVKIGDKETGKEVFKTETMKKTLDPTWKESIALPVPTLSGLFITFCVRDWDRISADDDIGFLQVNLENELGSEGEDLYEGWMPLSHGGEGELKLSICYDPPTNAKQTSNKKVFGVSQIIETEPSIETDLTSISVKRGRSSSFFATHNRTEGKYGRLLLHILKVSGIPDHSGAVVKLKLNGKNIAQTKSLGAGKDEAALKDYYDCPLEKAPQDSTVSFKMVLKSGNPMSLIGGGESFFDCDSLNVEEILKNSNIKKDGSQEAQSTVVLRPNAKSEKEHPDMKSIDVEFSMILIPSTSIES